MSADLSSQSSAPPAPVSTPARFPRALLVLLVLILLAAGGAATWWWGFRAPVVPVRTPPMPAKIEEEEIVVALEAKRAEVEAQPRSADAWGEYAMLLLAHLFAKEADECFDQAARLNPQDPRWPYGRGYIAVKRDPLNSSVPLDHLRQAVATTGPGDEFRRAARLLLAESLLERGRVDEAQALFLQEASGMSESAVRARYGLGLVAVARGETEAATCIFTGILNEPNTQRLARSQLAQFAHAHGDATTAARYEREAARRPESPGWSDPLHDRIVLLSVGRRGRERDADLFERQQRYDEALQVYLEQLEHERTPKALVGAGLNFLHKAIKESRLETRQRLYDEALTYLREAVERAPDDPNTNFNLARALFTRAERTAAEQPGHPATADWFKEVVVYAKRATELKPDHAQAYLFWGLALKYLKRPREAIAPFEKGLTARPESFELQLGLGQVLAQAGRSADAETRFENARKLDPSDPRPPQELKKLHEKPQ